MRKANGLIRLNRRKKCPIPEYLSRAQGQASVTCNSAFVTPLDNLTQVAVGQYNRFILLLN